MGNKYVWAVEDMKGDRLYCIFSTKGKAIEAIKMWSTSLISYSIETNTDMVPRLDGKAAIINIRYGEKGIRAAFYIHKIALNNGAGIIHSYRHNGGYSEAKRDSQ